MPTGTSGPMVTLNLVIACGFGAGCFGSGLGAGFLGSRGGGGGGMIGSDLMPGWLNSNVCGSSRSVPEKVTSTVVPALAPQGDRTNNFGFGKLLPAGGCPYAFPAHTNSANIRTENVSDLGAGSVSDRAKLLARNEEARCMDYSLIDDPRRETSRRTKTSEVSARQDSIQNRCAGSASLCLTVGLNDSGNRGSGSLDSSPHANGFAKTGQEIEG